MNEKNISKDIAARSETSWKISISLYINCPTSTKILLFKILLFCNQNHLLKQCVIISFGDSIRQFVCIGMSPAKYSFDFA